MMRQLFQYSGEQFKFYSYHHAQFKLSKNKSLPVQRKNSKEIRALLITACLFNMEKQAEKLTVGELINEHAWRTENSSPTKNPFFFFFFNKLMHIVKYL